MTKLTANQQGTLRKLGRKPLGLHFAKDRSERAILAPLVLSGLVRKSWNYGEWMYALTDNGLSALKGLDEAETWEDDGALRAAHSAFNGARQ